VDLARDLAESLRRMRKEAGLTHVEMAKRLKISRSAYTKLENGRLNTTLTTLTQLCRSLQCRVGDLFEGRAKLSVRR
jgi:DNA-binding XRE family transcriptional regulator